MVCGYDAFIIEDSIRSPHVDLSIALCYAHESGLSLIDNARSEQEGGKIYDQKAG